jgi:2-(1,2-epoxy-1,2-dihydrophenyl)acetyl-CoA isomerase
MLLGDRLPAPKALEWGLVNFVVPDAEVEARGMELAQRLADGPRSLGIIKRNAWAALDASLETALILERNGQRDATRTEDFVEGVTAFSGKRKPEFKRR